MDLLPVKYVTQNVKVLLGLNCKKNVSTRYILISVWMERLTGCSCPFKIEKSWFSVLGTIRHPHQQLINNLLHPREKTNLLSLYLDSMRRCSFPCSPWYYSVIQLIERNLITVTSLYKLNTLWKCIIFGCGYLDLSGELGGVSSHRLEEEGGRRHLIRSLHMCPFCSACVDWITYCGFACVLVCSRAVELKLE